MPKKRGAHMKHKPKLLILYASAGAGHKSAAASLCKVCNETNSAIAQGIDILHYTPKYFKQIYSGGYLEIVKRIPELWGYLYGRSYKSRRGHLSTILHRKIGNLHLGKLFKYVKQFNPDAIVFTHFLGWESLSRLKKINKIPFFCVVTDFAIHSLWISKHIDKYYVPTEGERRVLKRQDFNDSQIRITGIPVTPLFSQKTNKSAVLKKMKLKNGIPTILMISGRYNMSGYEQLLASFKDIKRKLQLIVLTGRNKALTEKLKRIAKRLKVTVRISGMIDNMHELMSISDLVVTKPGGLTTSEVLASNTPMAIIDPIPGQEQRNSDYLLESGVAIRIHDMDNGALKIADLLYDEKRMRIMRHHLKYVSRPKAAYDIVADITKSIKKCSR